MLDMVRIIWTLVAIVSTVIVLVPTAYLVGAFLSIRYVENHRYASKYFEGKVEFSEVLQSRRWIEEGALGCTYAIVSLPNGSPQLPPDSWIGQWAETPVRVPVRRRNIINRCLNLYPETLAQRLNDAQTEPGSYYDFQGTEIILLYSSRKNIAAWVRYGD